MTVYPAYPIVTVSDNLFVLKEAYKIKNIIIPRGYKSDGFTLKFRLFRLFISKNNPKFMPFFFVHDYLCDKEKYVIADSLGQDVLFEIEKSFRTKAIMFFIKKYHLIKYGVK